MKVVLILPTTSDIHSYPKCWVVGCILVELLPIDSPMYMKHIIVRRNRRGMVQLNTTHGSTKFTGGSANFFWTCGFC